MILQVMPFLLPFPLLVSISRIAAWIASHWHLSITMSKQHWKFYWWVICSLLILGADNEILPLYYQRLVQIQTSSFIMVPSCPCYSGSGTSQVIRQWKRLMNLDKVFLTWEQSQQYWHYHLDFCSSHKSPASLPPFFCTSEHWRPRHHYWKC